MFIKVLPLKKQMQVIIPFICLFMYVLGFGFYMYQFQFSDTETAKVSCEPKKITVILDAGHGGEDSGTVSKDGIKEKDLNLTVTKLIGNLLEEKGYEVIYTREDDRLLYREEENINGIKKISDLKNRTAMANENPEALFVSIHMNSFTSSKCEGLQVYYGTQNEKSKILAQKIQQTVKNELQPENDRQIKRGNDIYVLENTTAESILIECGFLSNEEESKKLSDTDYQKKLSFAIVCGIVEYINQK